MNQTELNYSKKTVQQLKEAVQWDEQFSRSLVRVGHPVVFDAKSYQKQADAFVRDIIGRNREDYRKTGTKDGLPLGGGFTLRRETFRHLQTEGDRFHQWRLKQAERIGWPFPLVKPKEDPDGQLVLRRLPLQKGARRLGDVSFTGDVRIPVLRHQCDIWMSYTPSEVLSQRGALRYASGQVMIGGLGLGWITSRVAERATVDHVLVVEQSNDLVNTIGAALMARYPGKVTVVIGDAYEHLERIGKRPKAEWPDKVLMDIWPSCDDANWDFRWQTIRDHLKGLGIWTWQWT